MLSSKDRAYLRGLANNLETILTVGRGGVTDATAADAANALRVRELIKGQVLETAPETAREAAEALAAPVRARESGAQAVRRAGLDIGDTVQQLSGLYEALAAGGGRHD